MKISLLIILTGLLLLTACGQNGPLYLPNTSSEESTDEETKDATAKEVSE